MVKGNLSDGTILLGLSRENVKRLMEGKPIDFDGREVGIQARVIIMFGETEQAIVDELEAQLPRR